MRREYRAPVAALETARDSVPVEIEQARLVSGKAERCSPSRDEPGRWSGWGPGLGLGWGVLHDHDDDEDITLHKAVLACSRPRPKKSAS